MTKEYFDRQVQCILNLRVREVVDALYQGSLVLISSNNKYLILLLCLGFLYKHKRRKIS